MWLNVCVSIYVHNKCVSHTYLCVCVCVPPDHAQSSYRVSADGSFLVLLASGMELSLTTEPLLPATSGGGVSPTASRCNISLPGDHTPSLVEWRQRKEQARSNYSTYERRLRVTAKPTLTPSATTKPTLTPSTTTKPTLTPSATTKPRLPCHVTSGSMYLTATHCYMQTQSSLGMKK